MKDYQHIPQAHHKEVKDICDGHIIVEEKIDGAQFRVQVNDKGEIKCGSHHQELSLVDSNFKRATDEAQQVFKHLHPLDGETCTFFMEYIAKVKANKIQYARIPAHGFVVFDVIQNGHYLSYQAKEALSTMLGLEVAPCLWEGEGKDFTPEIRDGILKSKSILGHQAGYDKIEGIVVKNYGKNYEVAEGHSLYGHFMCTKIVNYDFKERKAIKEPKAGNNIDHLKESVKSEARWQKAYQHLSEQGLLKNDMCDIPLMFREVVSDLEKEESETLKEELWKLFRKDILNASTEGLLAWYKEKLQNN